MHERPHVDGRVCGVELSFFEELCVSYLHNHIPSLLDINNLTPITFSQVPSLMVSSTDHFECYTVKPEGDVLVEEAHSASRINCAMTYDLKRWGLSFSDEVKESQAKLPF